MCLLLQIIWTWPEDIAVLLWRMMPSVHKYDIISDNFKYQLNTPPVSFIINPDVDWQPLAPPGL